MTYFPFKTIYRHHINQCIDLLSSLPKYQHTSNLWIKAALFASQGLYYVVNWLHRSRYLDAPVLLTKNPASLWLDKALIRYSFLNKWITTYWKVPKQKIMIPVISVGNYVWGGTGKTPCVEYLARFATSRGILPLILSRGYQGTDEVAQMRNHLQNVVIYSGKNRTEQARRALANHSSIGLAILDDGLQHYRLHRDLDIIVVDATCPFGTNNGKLIPYGSLREPLEIALQRAHLVLIHNANMVSKTRLKALMKFFYKQKKLFIPEDKHFSNKLHSFVACSALVPQDVLHFTFENLPYGPSILPVNVLQSLTRCVAFSGIGNPLHFNTKIRQLIDSKHRVKFVKYPDHYVYSEQSYEKLCQLGSTFITTEKDFFRSPRDMLENILAKNNLFRTNALYVLRSTLQPLDTSSEQHISKALDQVLCR